jgi:hypothetical protein
MQTAIKSEWKYLSGSNSRSSGSFDSLIKSHFILNDKRDTPTPTPTAIQNHFYDVLNAEQHKNNIADQKRIEFRFYCFFCRFSGV